MPTASRLTAAPNSRPVSLPVFARFDAPPDVFAAVDGPPDAVVPDGAVPDDGARRLPVVNSCAARVPSFDLVRFTGTYQ